MRVPATTRRMRRRDSRVLGCASSLASVSTSTSVMAAGATRIAVVVWAVPPGVRGDASVTSSVADSSAPVELPMKETEEDREEEGANEETEEEDAEDVDVDDEVEATAAAPDRAAVVTDVVVAVAASTSSQLGLQNFELRWRFRLLCMCVL
uniref:Uncharacterized protein n=1 Tax=Anopheles culicifacies TaxID=139723 RepID=A0A182MQH9_9DIPT